MRRSALGVVIAASLLVGGCGSSYYRVTDPSTGKEYYTTKVNQRSGGAVTLRDAATGDDVTLQNSNVTKVSKEVYETNRMGKH
jgi:hypothetical protein